MRQYDNKAKHALAVYISLFFLIVMGIVLNGYISYRNFEQEFRHQAERQISAIAELKVNDLVNWRKERLSDAQFLYHDPTFSKLVERYFNNTGDVEARELLLDQLDHYVGSAQYDRVRLLDINGVEKLSIPTAPDTLNTDLAVDAARSLRSGSVTFLDFYRDANMGGEIHLAFLVPIYVDKSNNTPLGILALSINPQTNLYPYVQSWPIPSDTAETLLVRRDGEDVLFLNKLRFGQDAPLTLRFPLTDTDLPAVKAVLGQAGAVEGVDYRDEPVLADVRVIPDSPWFLVSKMDTAEVYAPLRARLWQTLLIIGMAIFASAMALALVRRQQRILFYRAQVEAAEALRESEEKMRSIFRVAPTGIGVIRDRVLVEVNPRISEMTGYTKEELIGQSARILYLSQEEFDWVGKEKFNQIADKGSGVVETRWQKKDGATIDVLLSSTPIDLIDLSKGVTFTALDITERKQTEKALRDNQQLLQAVMDNIPQSIFWKDSQLIFLGCNSAFAANVGLASSHDIVGKTDWDLPSKHAELYRADDNFVMKSGIPKLNYEEPQTTPDGTTSWLRTSKVPMRNADGNVYAILGMFQDITEHKQAEDEIRKLNAELEQRVRERTVQLETTNRELEAFSYSVSHDLRAPLRGIDGWSQALVEDYHDQLDEEGRQYIARVRSETQRMGQLIDDMLKLSRLTRVEIIKKQVDLNTLAHVIAERLQKAEPMRKVDFNIQAGLTAEGDSRLLDVMLTNLLGNAFKFTAKRADAYIEFGQTELQGQYVFFVSDNGSGFDMAYSQKLFGAFQRMHKASEFPGTGIGLATVQRIIHRHGGRVWADAEVGRGATFYFTLG